MMVIKLVIITTYFGPSKGDHQVVHLASRVYTICKQTLFDDEISLILIHSKSLNYFTNHCTYINLSNLHIKTLKTLRHVSVLGPSSGSYIVLAKVTLLKVILISLFNYLV